MSLGQSQQTTRQNSEWNNTFSIALVMSEQDPEEIW